MDRLPNIHPGEVLLEEFLLPMNISAYRLAKETKLSQTRISQIIHGKRSISADTALRLAKFFGVSPEFWLGLQNDYDIEETSHSQKRQLASIRTASDLKLIPRVRAPRSPSPPKSRKAASRHRSLKRKTGASLLR